MNIMPNSGFFAEHFKRIALPFHTAMQNPGIVVNPPTHTGIGVVDHPAGGGPTGVLTLAPSPSAPAPAQSATNRIFGGALSNLFRAGNQ